VNYPISIKFGKQMQISVPKKIEILQIQDGVKRHIENRFWLYLSAILAD